MGVGGMVGKCEKGQQGVDRGRAKVRMAGGEERRGVSDNLDQ